MALALHLDSPIKRYRGVGQVIEKQLKEQASTYFTPQINKISHFLVKRERNNVNLSQDAFKTDHLSSWE